MYAAKNPPGDATLHNFGGDYQVGTHPCIQKKYMYFFSPHGCFWVDAAARLSAICTHMLT